MMNCYLTPNDLVFSNDLILEEIFRLLPTLDLLRSTCRINRKSSETARKLVQKRAIIVSNPNILRYCDFINNGGAIHPNIHLELHCNLFSPPLDEADSNKIIWMLSKIGGNVRELSLTSMDIYSKIVPGRSKRFAAHMSLLRRTLRSVPNLLKLSLDLIGLDIFSRFSELRLETIPTFANLSNFSLNLHMDSDPNKLKALAAFLNHSPSIQVINWPNSRFGYCWSLQDLRSMENLCPNFHTKLNKFKTRQVERDLELGCFLMEKNFSCLTKLELTWYFDPVPIRRVLDRFKDQLLALSLELSQPFEEINGEELFGVPPIHVLPVMKNLEVLDLQFSGFGELNPRWPGIHLWDSAQEFPKLREFSIYVWKFKREIVDRIFSTTFQDLDEHPKFPKVKKISGEYFRSGWDEFLVGMRKKNPSLFQRILKYFPNLSN